VHLGVAEALADLGLRELLSVVELHDDASPVVERLEQGIEGDPLECAVHVRVRHAHGIQDRAAVGIIHLCGPVQRGGMHGALGLEGVDDGFDVDTGVLRDLLHRRRRTGGGGELLVEPSDREGQLLQFAWRTNRPASVAEVALDRPGDARDGVGAERGAALDVERVDRSDQRERGNLFEILERLRCARVATRETAGQRQEALDESVTGRGVARPATG